VSATCAPEGQNSLTHFATTHWSLIRQGHTPGEQDGANSDLTKLCQIYWRPIFTFIYRRGHSAPDAQDLTQDFFLTIFDGTLLQSADPKLGRFRSLLLRSLKNFLIDAAVKRGRHKRGGQVQFISLESWMADTAAQLSIPMVALESSPPEALFDRGWAHSIAEEALCRLRTECESKGRRRVYEVFEPFLNAEREEISYLDLSSALGVPEQTVKNLLHKFRLRYRALLREEIAKTVESEANVDDEIRHLCAALSAGKGERPWK
jgi:RNA polymerase sigma factor (sigma-70 family)